MLQAAMFIERDGSSLAYSSTATVTASYLLMSFGREKLTPGQDYQKIKNPYRALTSCRYHHLLQLQVTVRCDSSGVMLSCILRGIDASRIILLDDSFHSMRRIVHE